MGAACIYEILVPELIGCLTVPSLLWAIIAFIIPAEDCGRPLSYHRRVIDIDSVTQISRTLNRV